MFDPNSSLRKPYPTLSRTPSIGLVPILFCLASFRSLRASAVYPCLAIRLASYVPPLVLTSLYVFAANYALYFVLTIINHVPAKSRPGRFKHSFLLSQS
ncbi:hypothetical protein BJV74DRAFT_857812 [Russula compacta]|nr:hypothetical protein BJV74DRAFT_857812 [Russula compacta]